MTSSALTDETLEQRRATARRDAGPFVDPRLFRKVEPILATLPQPWLERVVGGPVPDRRRMGWWAWLLVDWAVEADREHLAALTEQQRAEGRARLEAEAAAAQAAWQRRLDEWLALKERQPVPVFAAHNWTIGHYDGYVVGADHIVVLEPLHVGRFRRAAHEALCETPSKRRSGGPRLPDPLSHLEREPSRWTDPNRIPTCRPCLRRAERLAAR
jgi:hypothetical protein